MAKEKHLLFLTGKVIPDMIEECKQLEDGKPLPPTQCYVCKRQEGEESVARKVKSGSTEISVSSVKLRVKYVEANSTPDAKVFFPLCQDCSLLLDIWPSGDEPRQTTREDTTCE